MFFDFSSAFNTIQPRLLGDKLQLAGHRCSTGNWFWLLSCSPSTLQTFHTILHPVISRSSLMTLLLLASSQMGTTESTEDLFKDFADWCLRNNLQINAGKTKELVVDFRRRRPLSACTVWTGRNTNALVKKGNSRLFLLRRLRSFGVQGPLLRTFYDSVVASAIFYGIVCWASSITDRDRRRMDRLVRRASSVLGCPLDSVEVVGNGRRMMAKLSSLLNQHVPPSTGQSDSSGQLLQSVVEKTFSSPPPATSAYNGNLQWQSLPVVEPEQRRWRRKRGRGPES
ncbi:hypothetical protein L3Q82_014677 [Scortum barcoo]|uniref:Uncharacterized protein n=1 Tax=Scortum barcoo TaxID=214431 RepID=A0ACB8VS36_9TELE|nr:hypothetical protein L3Q82_014677 [Scortum barcoo]